MQTREDGVPGRVPAIQVLRDVLEEEEAHEAPKHEHTEQKEYDMTRVVNRPTDALVSVMPID